MKISYNSHMFSQGLHSGLHWGQDSATKCPCWLENDTFRSQRWSIWLA